ncbi:AMP-binding protein [Variovorax saccharolyticus]|uniref:AMP-binding protein n=1 Tax=Variovorax saccharolyticus TaxID=3053516 RepID=UPI002576FA3F|nr:AMP-binding protein [Variovorax sp. J31P216]MDM0030187.1 AMP-binding protein [Variovorax sp. J31P216]
MSYDPPRGPATIVQRLLQHAQTSPNKLAYRVLRQNQPPQTITYRDLSEDVQRLATVISRRARVGSRALLLYPSGLEFIKAYLACLYAGVLAVPSSLPRNARHSPRLAAILEDCTPSLVLTTLELLAAGRAACVREGVETPEFFVTDAPLPTEDELIRPQPGPLAFLQYTSGSTGAPKGVEVSHHNIISNSKAIERAFDFDPQSVMVGWLPLFHDMGLIGQVLAPLHVGFCSVMMAPEYFLKEPAAWLRAISEYRATCAGAPNFGWDYCANRIDATEKAGLDLSCLQVAFNGSEPVRAATLERFARAFGPQGFRREAFFVCYGMAETTLLVSGGPVGRGPAVLHVSKASLEGNHVRSAAPGSDDARAIVSCGPVSEDISVVIVDPDTRTPCSPRRLGEIWISGASVAAGYWNRPEETTLGFGAHLAASGKGPYLRSGDLGFLHEGELFVTGRLKDLIIVNGRNVYPQDIEAVIERYIAFVGPDECAVFTVEEDDQESVVIVAEANRALLRAVREPTHGVDADTSAARDRALQEVNACTQAACDAITEEFGLPVSSFVFVKAGGFPRTSSGKVQRSRARQLFLDAHMELVHQARGAPRYRASSLPVPALSVPVLSVTVSTGSGALAYPTDVPAETATEAQVPRRADLATERVEARVDATQPAVEPGSRRKADELIAWLRDYAERRLNSQLIDERRTVPPYVVMDLGNKGFFGLQAPPSVGGCGLTTFDLLRVLEQLAAIDLTLALLVGVHNGLGLRPLQRFGSLSQRETWLTALATGRTLAGFALTEVAAGSNPLAMRATAVKTEGGWILNAQKEWIGLASWAGVLVVVAKASTAQGVALGLIALLVPESTAGVSQGPEALTLGMRGIVQNAVRVDNAFLPDNAVIGEVGGGMRVAQDAMMFSRLGIAAMSLGAMKRSAQLMMRYAARRQIGTGVLIDNAHSLTTLADLACAIRVTQVLIERVAQCLDAGQEVPDEVYIACKTSAPEYLGDAADRLVQMLGARGYLEHNEAPRLLRDARVLRIFEGPTETLYMHLGIMVLKDPASVSVFLTSQLQASDAAELLTDTVAELRSICTRFCTPFVDAVAALQWLQLRTGELATAAFAIGAAEYFFVSGDPTTEAQRTLRWARHRFMMRRDEAHAWLSSCESELHAAALQPLVAGYEDAIGDIQQNLMGESSGLDELLRRAENLVIRSEAAPAIQAAPPILAAVSPGAKPARMEPPVPPSRQLVHAGVLNWLRVEKRRPMDTVEDHVTFVSMGMDSLSVIALVGELEMRTGLELGPEVLYDCQSVGRLVEYVDGVRTAERNRCASQVESPDNAHV